VAAAGLLVAAAALPGGPLVTGMIATIGAESSAVDHRRL